MTRQTAFIITLLLLIIVATYVAIKPTYSRETDNALEVLASITQDNNENSSTRIIVLYGFNDNSMIVNSLKAHEFEVISKGDDASLSDIGNASAIVINAHMLFIEKTISMNEMETIVRSMLLQGKPVAFVSEKGIDVRGLKDLLRSVLKDRPRSLENTLTSLDRVINYEIRYDDSGNVVSNETVQETCYVFVLKLLENSNGVVIYDFYGPRTISPTVINEYLIFYLKEAIKSE